MRILVGVRNALCKTHAFEDATELLKLWWLAATRSCPNILAEGAIALSVTLSGGALFAS